MDPKRNGFILLLYIPIIVSIQCVGLTPSPDYIPMPIGCNYLETLYIYNDQEITNLNSFLNITNVSTLSVRECYNLVNIDGIQNIQIVRNQLDIIGNILLTNIDGLKSLTHVFGNFAINNHPVLENIEGLRNLKYVGGSMDFYDNAMFNLNGLHNLSSVGNILTIVRNIRLYDITGLNSLNNLSYYYIDQNPIQCNKSNFDIGCCGDNVVQVSNLETCEINDKNCSNMCINCIIRPKHCSCIQDWENIGICDIVNGNFSELYITSMPYDDQIQLTEDIVLPSIFQDVVIEGVSIKIEASLTIKNLNITNSKVTISDSVIILGSFSTRNSSLVFKNRNSTIYIKGCYTIIYTKLYIEFENNNLDKVVLIDAECFKGIEKLTIDQSKKCQNGTKEYIQVTSTIISLISVECNFFVEIIVIIILISFVIICIVIMVYPPLRRKILPLNKMNW